MAEDGRLLVGEPNFECVRGFVEWFLNAPVGSRKFTDVLLICRAVLELDCRFVRQGRIWDLLEGDYRRLTSTSHEA